MRYRDPERPARLDDGFADIPYRDFAPRILDGREQALVPLLGAGASRTWSTAQETIPQPVDQALLQELAAKLTIQTEEAQLFLEVAVAVIARLNAQPPAVSGSAYDAVRASQSAPSAAELAQALAEKSSYDYFGQAKRRVFDLTGRKNWDDAKLTRLLVSLTRLTAIGSPVPPLLDASSYLADRKARTEFWSDLHLLFKDKQQSTATHALVAKAAAQYIAQNKDDVTAADYLVITTNYDWLLERAFDELSVPYYVLTVPNNADPPTVDLRFSAKAREHLGMTDAQFQRMVRNSTMEGDPPRPKATTQFSGLTNKVRPLAAIYKIHGSLHLEATADKDGVVITNEDYVTFLSVGFVPGYVRARLAGMGFLLLGYSFSDWNVRSLYRSVTKYRNTRQQGETMDYAVLLNPSPYETGFFDKNRIDIFDTPLDLFCKRMVAAIP